jgi:hypothetical protein
MRDVTVARGVVYGLGALFALLGSLGYRASRAEKRRWRQHRARVLREMDRNIARRDAEDGAD